MTVGYYYTVGAGGYVASFLGGESRDSLVDGGYTLASLPTGWSVVSTPVRTGSGAWQCNVDGTQSAAPFPNFYVTAGAGSYVGGPQGAFYLSAAPSAAFSLFGALAANYYCIECAPSVGSPAATRIRLVKVSADAGQDRWTNRAAVTGWSSGTVAATTWTKLDVLIDDLTLAAGHRWIHVLLDGTEEFSLDIGAATVQPWFPCSGSGTVDSGITVTWDDLAAPCSTTAADAPHLAAWPDPVVHRQLATGDSPTETDFAKAGSAAGAGDGTFTEWDEAAGNDGDTTFNWEDASVSTDRQQASTGQNAAAAGVTGHTVLHRYNDATVGPVINIVHKNADNDTKFAGYAYNSLGANPIFLEPGTSYEGGVVRFPQTGGWDVDDLALLEFGVEIPYGAEHNQEWRISLCMMQWLTYVDTLPLTTTPTLPGAAAKNYYTGGFANAKRLTRGLGFMSRRLGLLVPNHTLVRAA